MAWSFTATLAILLAGAWFLRNNQTPPEESRRNPENVSSSAKADQESVQIPSKPKGDSPSRPKAPKIELSSVSAVAAESIASRAQGRMKTNEERQHENDLNQRIQALDEEQLEEFVAEVSAIKDLPPAEWSWWAYRALIRLGETNPDKALEILADQIKASNGFTMAGGSATAIISQIATKNPDKAFAKLDEYASGLPGLKREAITSDVLIRLARSDLPKTLQLVESRLEPFGHDAVKKVVSLIANSCYQEAQCLEVLDYLNRFQQRCNDPKTGREIQDAVISGVARNLAKNGYTATESWMRESKLPRSLYLQVGFETAKNSRTSEVGKWLEWVGREQPYQSLSETKDQVEWCQNVRKIAEPWVRRDTQSFGAWLDTQPPSSVKNMCIMEFIYEIGWKYPDTAAGWIEKMNNPEDRKFMYTRVHEDGVFESAEEREAFGKLHGLR